MVSYRGNSMLTTKLYKKWLTETTLPPKKASSITGLDRHTGFQEFEAPIFHDNWHMKVVTLSALCTSCLHPPGNSRYSFLLEAEST